MAHLLMVESWVGASGRMLPPLLKSLGHTYTFATRNPKHYDNSFSEEKHPVFQYANEVVIVETNDIEELKNKFISCKFDGIITVCDYYIELVKELSEILKIPCPFPKNVKNIRRKDKLREIINVSNLPNPKYKLASNLNEIKEFAKVNGFPFVLKPADLASSAFVRIIRNETDMEDAYLKLKDFPLNFRKQERDDIILLEEYMDGPEFSVESVSFNGDIKIIGITDKSLTGDPYFIENGHMFPADLSAENKNSIENFVLDVLKAVEFDNGLAHTEVKLTKNGPRIVEINPRNGGNYIVELVELVTGVNLLENFIDIAIGRKPNTTILEKNIKSAASIFIVPSEEGTIESIFGIENLKNEKNLVRYSIENCIGKYIDKPIDNACYLGHFIVKDENGLKARSYAEEILKTIKFNMKKEKK